MYKKLNFLLLSLFLLFIIIPFISSKPPVTQIQQFSEGYIIEGSPTEYIKQSQDYQFNFFLYNISNGRMITNSEASCIFYMANNSGHVLLFSNVPYFPDGHWGLNIGGSNFSNMGHYPYGVKCNSTRLGGAMVNYFEVNPTGSEVSVGKSIIDIGLLSMLLIFFIIVIIMFITFDNLISRVGMIGVGYLLLIGITFISWNMANDFLISTPFIVSMFRILFFILIIGFLPLVMGGFAWYLIMLFKIKEIENLMKHGLSEQEAYHRTGRKYKRK